MLKLRQRLLTIAQMVPQGARVADIGTDHALLPCYLLKEGIAAYVLGVEIRPGPYAQALSNVQKYGLRGKVELRLGDGLSVVQPGEVNVVILAGLGGTNICQILSKALPVLSSVAKIIVQPMGNVALLRSWLAEQGWSFCEAELLYEEKQYYQIFSVVPGGNCEKLSELEMLYGSLLIKKRHPLLKGLIEKDLKEGQEILEELAKSKRGEAEIRRQKLQERVEKLKELRKWLSAVKP